MAERLLKAGYDVSIWNRTRSKGRAARQDPAARSSTSSAIFPAWTWCSPSSPKARMSNTVYLGKDGVLSGNKAPGVFVDCSTISVEESVRHSQTAQ